MTINKKTLTESEFIAIASHDLRTSLTAIAWLIDFLKKERLTKHGREHLDDIGNCVDRMNTIVDTLAAKKTTGERRLV